MRAAAGVNLGVAEPVKLSRTSAWIIRNLRACTWQRSGDLITPHRRATNVLRNLVASGGVGVRIFGPVDAVPITGGPVLMLDGNLIRATGVWRTALGEDREVVEAG